MKLDSSLSYKRRFSVFVVDVENDVVDVAKLEENPNPSVSITVPAGVTTILSKIGAEVFAVAAAAAAAAGPKCLDATAG